MVVGSSPTRSIRPILLFLEDYPSPAEGNGLENRQACKSVQGFESLILLFIYYRGVEKLASRRAHNPKVVGSSPTPAIFRIMRV